MENTCIDSTKENKEITTKINIRERYFINKPSEIAPFVIKHTAGDRNESVKEEEKEECNNLNNHKNFEVLLKQYENTLKSLGTSDISNINTSDEMKTISNIESNGEEKNIEFSTLHDSKDGENVITVHDHTKTLYNGDNNVIYIIKCKKCEKLLEVQEDSISCDECLESQATVIPNKLTKTNPVDDTENTTIIGDCCCSCHENIPNSTKGTDTITNFEINADEATIVSGNRSNKSPESCTNENICRICLDNADQGQLIAPCRCSGSTKYAHEQCLLKWFFKSSKKSCEVCLGNVNVTPIGYKPVQQWRLPDRGCDFIVYLFGLYFLIMVIFTGMITWIATQGCTSPVCVTLYSVCGIALLYFIYCCGCVEYSRRYWRALLSVNRIWRIYGREDSVRNLKLTVTPKLKKRDKVITVRVPTREEVDTIRPYVIEVSENRMPNLNTNISCTIVNGLDNYAAEFDEETIIPVSGT